MKNPVWCQYSSITLCYPSADPRGQISIAPMQYPHPQYVTMKQQNVGFFTAWGDVLSFWPLRCPWDEKSCVLQGACLSPSLVLSLCEMTTHIWKYMHNLQLQEFALYLLRETCAKSCDPALVISFCLASTSLQNPTEFHCSQCYPWDHGKMQGSKRNGVAWGGFQSFWLEMYTLEPLTNFVLKHGFSALQAINLRQSSHLQCNTVKCNNAE